MECRMGRLVADAVSHESYFFLKRYLLAELLQVLLRSLPSKKGRLRNGMLLAKLELITSR